MDSLIEYITEALKVNSKSKVNQKRELDPNADIDYLESEIYFRNISDENKYRHYVQRRKEKNDYKSMLKTSSQRNLITWWYFAIVFGWEDGYEALKEEIIKRNSYDEDELDTYVLKRYYKLRGFENTLKNMEKYFETYNIKYDRDKVQ